MAKAKAQSLTEISTYWIGLYDAVQVKRILTVGDGNFSFSLSLARSLCPESGVQLVVTSHESKTTVLETYPDGEKILDELNAMSNVTVKHEVDATDAEMIKTLGHFDRVIWNFPCVRAPRGEDGQNEAMEMNKKLLHEFFSHVGQVLTSCGEVHVTHKTKAPFGQWGIDNIAKTNKFYHKLSVVFDRCLYPGYTNKKVLSKGSFPIWDSQTFIFVPEERTQVPADVAIPDNEKSDIRLIEIVTMDILKKVYILLTPSLDETLGSRKKRGGFSDKGGRSSNSYKDVIRNRTDSRKDQKRKRLASDGLNGCKQLGKKKGRRS